MIVVDTSALIAILKNEPDADACQIKLQEEETILISAGTLTEVTIVAGQNGLSALLRQLLKQAAIQCVPLSEDDALTAGEAYSRWGRRNHDANLNFGDCFAYMLAKQQNCPLLYIGNDFAQTDIVNAIPSAHVMVKQR